MKQLWIIAICVAGAAQAQEKFILEGKLKQSGKDPMAYLFYRHDNDNIKDSVKLDSGTFKFSGEISEPTQATLILNHGGVASKGKRDLFKFYLERGTIQIRASDSISKAIVLDSKINGEDLRLQELLTPVNEKMGQLYSEYQKTAPEIRKSETFKNDFLKKQQDVEEERKEVWLRFIKTNPNSYLSLDLLKQYAGYIPNLEVVNPLFSHFSTDVKNSPSGKQYAAQLEAMKATSVGQPAPVFLQNDSLGKPVSLKDFKGKFVLIDFWASWCGPCRAENPHVVKAYEKYKDKNFTVLGVSIDDEKGRGAWLKAVKDDGLVWTQVSDLKGWKNEAASKYAVQAIPQNFLIDPNGIIVAKNLRGEALAKTLEELLPN